MGGGLYRDCGDLTVTNSTFAGNVALSIAGGINCYASNTGYKTVLNNSIVAGNSAGMAGSGDAMIFATNSTGVNNLIGDATFLTGWTNDVNGNLLGTTASPIDPKFVAPDSGNYQLSLTSPAINTGKNTLAVDPSGTTITSTIDNIPRAIYNTVDMGAYEFRLLGDANLDRLVDSLDVALIAANWLNGATWGRGDFNGDDTVDSCDVALLASNWLTQLPQTQTMSESPTVVDEEPPVVVDEKPSTGQSTRQTTSHSSRQPPAKRRHRRSARNGKTLASQTGRPGSNRFGLVLYSKNIS